MTHAFLALISQIKSTAANYESPKWIFRGVQTTSRPELLVLSAWLTNFIIHQKLQPLLSQKFGKLNDLRVTVKLFLCLTDHQTMKTDGEVEVQLHAVVFWTPDGDGQLNEPAASPPCKEAPVLRE
jgi:hypothetical protein